MSILKFPKEVLVADRKQIKTIVLWCIYECDIHSKENKHPAMSRRPRAFLPQRKCFSTANEVVEMSIINIYSCFVSSMQYH